MIEHRRLRPWLGLVFAGMLAPTLALGVVRVADDSPAAQALYAQPIGADPSVSWPWARVLEAVRADGAAEANALRRGLLDLYLRQAAGEPWLREATVSQAIASGRALGAIEFDRDAQRHWAQALNRQLHPVWPGATVDVPEELRWLADRMKSVAPGLWTRASADGTPQAATWALTLRHAGDVVLTPARLTISLLPDSLQPIDFDCERPRGEVDALLRPGEALNLICRSQITMDDSRYGWKEAVQRLAARDASVMRFRPGDLHSKALPAMYQLLADAAPSPLAAFETRFASCESRGRCEIETRAARDVTQAKAIAKASRWRDKSTQLFALIAAFTAFVAVARWWGERTAATLMFGAVTILAVIVGLATMPLGLLIGPAVWGAGFATTVAFFWASRLYTRLFFT